MRIGGGKAAKHTVNTAMIRQKIELSGKTNSRDFSCNTKFDWPVLYFTRWPGAIDLSYYSISRIECSLLLAQHFPLKNIH